MIIAYSIRVYGHVFNVGFRRFVDRIAQEFSINGFVENSLEENCVYIECEGEENKLQLFIEACRHGSPYSNVTSIELHEMELKNFKNFIQYR